ncbi:MULTISPECIES: AraC family transcriptional regulator [unclassified Bradyrhizobium]|uniref:helix-turn-helix transcriptional regulator n=1 Tax=unclassified Bradyrhizobium TaxID=2631580 RepID=UPI00247943E9|nr:MULTISPECIES: AraC family transcriptional regulator [unclassified Bradyrhizobium]WGR73367.1 AraC family transcriptional regulator [Bradyrhizobium sp. ISRA426]WGR78204.1 AraC family transcriptional regulator [Bradyrhizobium sp. ISRA430]WGR88605.1 AraC family transcriptional regulator [Bradyrhizobium sp. ISRA432]
MDAAKTPGIFFHQYAGLPRGPAFEQWRDRACGPCGLDVGPSRGDSIDCRLRISVIGDIALAVPEGASAQYSRTQGSLADGSDDLVLISAHAGLVRIGQNGRTIELAPSQMMLADMSVSGTVGHTDEDRFTTIRMPRRALLEISPRAEDKLSQVLSDGAVAETIFRYHALAADHGPHLDAVGQRLTALHMIDLVGLLLGTDAEHANLARGRGQAAARLDLMRADVMSALNRNDLCLSEVAARYGLSPRQAQRLFEQAGTTFTEFVLEQRLLLARKLLGDPRAKARKISDIAHSAGFSDLSYFNRAFRKRFGATPSELRGA